MTADEKARLSKVEGAIEELWKEVSARLKLTPENEKVFHQSLKLAVFLVNFWNYGKVLGTVLMAGGTAYLLLDKLLGVIPK